MKYCEILNISRIMENKEWQSNSGQHIHFICDKLGLKIKA